MGSYLGWSPTFTNSPATTGTLGSSYTYAPTTNESATFTMVSKPTWATFSANTITGTPTAGVFTFSLKATSTAGTLSSYKNWTVTVNQQWAPTFTNSPSTSGSIGVSYSYAPTTNESVGYPNHNIPSWATFTVGTGTVSGTPTSGGIYSVGIKATSVNGLLSTWKNWSISVPSHWAPTFTNSPATTGTIGGSYSYTPTANESATFASIQKPAWASWSGSVMSGTPSISGVYQFELSATSTAGTLAAYKFWNVSIAQHWAPTWTSVTPASTGTIGSAYSYTPTTNESSTITAPTLPSGATFVGGLISFTPSNGGTYSFSVKAVSTAGTLSAWKNWTVSVPSHWAPAFTNSPATTSTIDGSYSYSPTTNESATFASIIKPSGATFAGSAYTYTPSAGGIYEFELSATSTAGTLTSYRFWNVSVPSHWSAHFTTTPASNVPLGSVYSYTAQLNESGIMIMFQSPSGAFFNDSGSSGSLNWRASALGTYQFELVANSANGTLTSYQFWNVTVTRAYWAPTFTSGTPSGTESLGSLYTYTPATNESSIITAPTLPSGATFTSGVLYWTPGTIGTYSFSIQADSTAGTLTAWRNWTVTVVRAYWGPLFTSTPAGGVLTGSIYSYTAELNESGSIVMMTSPSGAWFNSTVLTWRASAVGTYEFELVATSASGTLSTSQWFNVTVSSIPRSYWAPSFVTTPGSNVTNGSIYSYAPRLNESGTIAMMHYPSGAWCNDSGSMAQLVWRSASLGVYEFQLVGTSNNGTLSSSQWFNVSVLSSITFVITSSPVLNATTHTWYEYDANASMNCTWAAVGILPSWMHLNNNTGALTGTPTAAGRVLVTLRATSIQYNTSATQSFNVTVTLASNGGDDNGGGGTTTGGQTNLQLNIPTLWLLIGAGMFLLLIIVVARRRK